LLNQNAETKKRLEIWSDFFREKAHILRRGNEAWPAHKILLQLAVEHADDSPLTIAAEAWLPDGRCKWFWLRRIQRLRHLEKNPWLAILEGHTGWVKGALELEDGQLATWSGDGTVRLWDGKDGKCVRVLNGHSGPILVLLC